MTTKNQPSSESTPQEHQKTSPDCIDTGNNNPSDATILSLSDMVTKRYLQLITKCALLGEMTGSQMDLIEYLQDLMYKIGSDPEAACLDIAKMPWNACSIEEDKKYLQDQINRAKEPGMPDYLMVTIDPETAFPWLDTFAQMIGVFEPDRSGRKYYADPKKAGLRFKKNFGWKACFDEERGICTAERGGRGFYQLCEIDKDTYDKLDPAAEDGVYSDKLISEGRVLFEADDDYCTMPYCSVKDENYHELAPWSRAKARYERTYNG